MQSHLYNYLESETGCLKKYQSPLNNQSYEDFTTGCVYDHYHNDHRYIRMGPPRHCRDRVKSYFQSQYPKNLIENCNQLEFELQFTSTKNIKTSNIPHLRFLSKYVAMINFNFHVIEKITCSYALPCHKGGSSFTIDAMASKYDHPLNYHSCSLNNSINPSIYSFSCQLYLHSADNSTVLPTTVDINVTILLDYFLYQGYNGEHGHTLLPLNYILFQNLKVPPLLTQHTSSSSSSSSSSSLSSIIPSLPLSTRPITKDTINLERLMNIYLIGSSHMRYLWDTISLLYFKNSSSFITSLPTHHGDASINHFQFHYQSLLFSFEVPYFLLKFCQDIENDLHSSSSVLTNSSLLITIVIEIGSWDLTYYPIYNAIKLQNSSNSIFNTIKRIQTSPCGPYIKIIWLTTFPIPAVCDGHFQSTERSTAPILSPNIVKVNLTFLMKTAISQRLPREGVCKDLGFRNNVAIQSFNEYFVDKLKTFSTGVDILDGFQLIFPHRHEHVCGLHYLCAKRKKKIETISLELLTTRGGLKVVESLIQIL